MQKKRVQAIETERLLLISMSLEFLQAVLTNQVEEASTAADFLLPVPCSLTGMTWVITRRMQLIKEDHAQHPWMYRAIVRKHDKQMVGFISFHHKAPDPDLFLYSQSAAELGYTIEKEYRRQGYAKESAVAMMSWARREHNVQDFILTISPGNTPSLKMAESMGFQVIGERMDEIDGRELVMKVGC
jgi:RimJ/RimL family protein N-acetyltransferase